MLLLALLFSCLDLLGIRLRVAVGLGPDLSGLLAWSLFCLLLFLLLLLLLLLLLHLLVVFFVWLDGVDVCMLACRFRVRVGPFL